MILCGQGYKQTLRNKRTCLHNVSVSSLFIFDIFEETLRSIVRSPISTIKPPMMSGLT